VGGGGQEMYVLGLDLKTKTKMTLARPKGKW
jgi:hypothetical protein